MSLSLLVKCFFATLLFVGAGATFTKETMPGAKYYDGKKISLPMSGDAHIELIEHWMFQAYSSFLSAFATKKYSIISVLIPKIRKISRCFRKKRKKIKQKHEQLTIPTIICNQKYLSIPELPTSDRRAFTKCSKRASSLHKHAKCIVDALKSSKNADINRDSREGNP